ncbi:MAG: tRNA (adenine(22)-N(1))-methyltransferase TrmK [Oscillospiraceae bacterium]|nr:tRNA (adenine(22)-N(1))-methyltransferase TrmK [Oscillospiraceae bacterium]
MENKKFKKNDSGFVCLNCQKKIGPLLYSSRNHCPFCLYSLHLDIMPGDRKNPCGGLLKPILAEPDSVSKNTYTITFQCEKCGEKIRNRSAEDDETDLLIFFTTGEKQKRYEINIDNRLKKIAEFIYGNIIADIGSDHAYLPIWLIQQKKISKAYAVDISENCIKKIKANLKKHNISEDIIIPVCSDGFLDFEYDLDEITDIVIAGMGGETISQIIENMKSAHDIKNLNFVLQPNSKIEYLKKYLTENNIEIKKLHITESKKRSYTIINAKQSGDE